MTVVTKRLKLDSDSSCTNWSISLILIRSLYIFLSKLICMQVLETTHQVGRISVSTASDMPYMEMAGHCEALQMGQQKKLSAFTVAQQRQESLIRFSTQDRNVVNEVPPSVVLGVPMVLPFSWIDILNGKILEISPSIACIIVSI